MANPSVPRAGSPAHIAICYAVRMGGTARFSEIVQLLKPEHQSVFAFRQYVIQALLDLAYVTVGDNFLKATAAGKEYAGKHVGDLLPRSQKYVGQIVPARSVVSTAALDVNRLRHTRPIRPGADDHLQIPSLMGNTRKLPSGEVIG